MATSSSTVSRLSYSTSFSTTATVRARSWSVLRDKSVPSMHTRPLKASLPNAIAFSSVDLPLPLAPKRDTSLPYGICQEMSRVTRREPYPVDSLSSVNPSNAAISMLFAPYAV